MADKTQNLRDYFAGLEAQKILDIALDRVLDITRSAKARYFDDECMNGDDLLRLASRMNLYADAMEAVDQDAVKNGEVIDFETEKEALKADKEIRSAEKKVEDLIDGLFSGGLPIPMGFGIIKRKKDDDDVAGILTHGGRGIRIHDRREDKSDFLPLILNIVSNGLFDKIFDLGPNETDKSAENGEDDNHVLQDGEEPYDPEMENGPDDDEVQDTADDENVEDEGSIGEGVIDEDETVAEPEHEQVTESEPAATEADSGTVNTDMGSIVE